MCFYCISSIYLNLCKKINQCIIYLQLFYDADILEESVLLDWASKISKKYVSKELSQDIHNNANQFITWLREAEEEEESGEESDDEVEVN